MKSEKEKKSSKKFNTFLTDWDYFLRSILNMDDNKPSGHLHLTNNFNSWHIHDFSTQLFSLVKSITVIQATPQDFCAFSARLQKAPQLFSF